MAGGDDLIIGFHFIFSAYGFWLPNDPRGSWSQVVREWELLRYGTATKVQTTRSLAGDGHDHRLRQQAKQTLRHPPVVFDGRQALAIARGFHIAAQQSGYRMHALAILPEHTHLVTSWHRHHVDTIASHLKGQATAQLNREKINPMIGEAGNRGRLPSIWARNYWCPFIRTKNYMHAAISYVETNPLKEGKPRQNWSFLQPWP